MLFKLTMQLQLDGRPSKAHHHPNSNGETPLFIAAHHGNRDTFLSVHGGIYNEGKNKPDESLDGNFNRDNGAGNFLP